MTPAQADQLRAMLDTLEIPEDDPDRADMEFILTRAAIREELLEADGDAIASVRRPTSCRPTLGARAPIE